MNTGALERLVATWRHEAELFARRGLKRESRFCESFAAELEAGIRAWLDEALPYEEAAGEVGIKYDALRKRVERGLYPNVGTRGTPRVRRGDLLSSNGSDRQPATGVIDIAEQVLRGRE